ncbi:unnamed protein product [Amoebophrya sp. A120]|nr:unnamed protein product [Amoebophrya sp. A120]|eukprot:GSA120T00002520001.1
MTTEEVGAEVFLDLAALRRHVSLTRRKSQLVPNWTGDSDDTPSISVSRTPSTETDSEQSSPGKEHHGKGSCKAESRSGTLSPFVDGCVVLDSTPSGLTTPRKRTSIVLSAAALKNCMPAGANNKAASCSGVSSTSSAFPAGEEEQLCSYSLLFYHFALSVNCRYFTSWTLLALAVHVFLPGSFLDDYARAIRATIIHVALIAFLFVWVHPRCLLVDNRIRLRGNPFRFFDLLAHHLPCALYLVWYHVNVVQPAKEFALDHYPPVSRIKLHTGDDAEAVPTGAYFATFLFSPVTFAREIFSRTTELYGWDTAEPGLYRLVDSCCSLQLVPGKSGLSSAAATTGPAPSSSLSLAFAGPRYTPERAHAVATTPPLWNFLFYALYRFYLAYLAKIDAHDLYGVQFKVLWVMYFVSLWL